MYYLLFVVFITLKLCELLRSAPLPLSGMSVYGMDVHTALTAKVLKLLKKTLCTNFFVPLIMLTNITKKFF
jgi:hypothetical protein